MKTSNRYNRSEIMKQAWKEFKQDIENGVNSSFRICLTIAWRNAKRKANLNTSDISSVSDCTNGNVWGDRIYFNSANGAVYAEQTISGDWTMGIKRSDLTPFTKSILNSFLSEKANELQSLGLILK